MRTFADKEIKKLFLQVSAVWAAALLFAEGFMGLVYQRFSLCLFLILLLAAGAGLLACFRYFQKQDELLEQAVSQISAYLNGDINSRLECNSEGELYRLFTSFTMIFLIPTKL